MNNTDANSNPRDEKSQQSASSTGVTVNEREALISEIVHEIRKDSIKEDASSKLKKEDWPKRISKFFQHPAVLIVIGFAITGLIGGWLANRWQSQEWERQQIRLLDINGIGVRYKLIDEITKSLGERNAAAMGILTPLNQGIDAKQLNMELAEPIKNWQKATNEWRVNSQILKLRIDTYIVDARAAELFQEIIKKERKIFANVTIVKDNLTDYTQAGPAADIDSTDVESGRQPRKELDQIRNDIEETGRILKDLVDVIVKEARKEVLKGGP